MATELYIVRAGDWLAKIADEHGTTVLTIWRLPENAAHRAKRRSPDVLYPGDVLHIPLAVQPSDTEAENADAVAGPIPDVVLRWPYPANAGPWSSGPNWDCPGGTCACHGRSEDEQRVPHRIVFYDPEALRLPGARCRVFEQGRLLTPTTADARGEIELMIRASTKTLQLEWAPADMPDDPLLPYRVVYHVVLGEDDVTATARRLANLGFSRSRMLSQNISDYQRAYGQAPTGELEDVGLEILTRHDDGLVPMFPPTEHEMQHVPAEAHSFFASPLIAAPGLPARQPIVEQRKMLGAAGKSTGPGPGLGRSGQSPSGAAEPGHAHVALVVALSPTGSLASQAIWGKPIKVSLLPKDATGLKAQLKPLDALQPWDAPGITRGTYVVSFFKNVKVGKYDALAYVGKLVRKTSGYEDYALGSQEVNVQKRALNIFYVEMQAGRPILTVDDPVLELDVDPMQRRRKVLATFYKLFPQSEDWRASEKGIQAPYEQGPYKRMLTLQTLEEKKSNYQNSCVPVNSAVMMAASGNSFHRAADAKTKPLRISNPGYVKYATGRAPSVGDVFFCRSGESFGHTGTVVQSSLQDGGIWLPADGGQPDRTSPFQHREREGDAVGSWRRYYDWGQPWKPDDDKKVYPCSEGAYIVARRCNRFEDSGRARLVNLWVFPVGTVDAGEYIDGWVDITHPGESFPHLNYGAIGSEADYQAMKAMLSAGAKRGLPMRVDEDLNRCNRIVSNDIAKKQA